MRIQDDELISDVLSKDCFAKMLPTLNKRMSFHSFLNTYVYVFWPIGNIHYPDMDMYVQMPGINIHPTIYS